MESKMSNNISVDIPNYSGPLETLLELAKTQKVDLTKISITKLADEFGEFIKNFKDKNLDIAFEYLLMATWLTYLKSRLLLPDDEDDNFKASVPELTPIAYLVPINLQNLLSKIKLFFPCVSQPVLSDF